MDNKGEWLQWRKDSMRTGHSTLPGKINEPEIISETFIGAYEDFIVIPKEGGEHSLLLSNINSDEINEDEIRKEYEMDLYLDVEGTGTEEKVEENIMVRYIKKESGKGYYRVRFEFAFENERWGSDEPTYGYLEERVNGEWQTIWRTEPDAVAFWRPNLLLTDINNDGIDEIITTEKGRLIAYDFNSGEKIRDLTYHKSRNYGEYFAYDFTGNGYPDFFSIVHFPAHAEVILNDGKDFSCAWIDNIQETIADTDKLLVTVINPISDLDEDGKAEIIFSRFNQLGDHKWYTTVLEPVSGELKYSIADFVTVEILNTGIDDKPQLYGYMTDGSYINPEANAAIYEIVNGQVKKVFSDHDMFWFQYLPRTPFSACIPRTKIVSLDGRTILCGKKLNHENYRLSLNTFQNGKMIQSGSVVLPTPSIQYVTGKGDILIKTVRSDDYLVNAEGFKMKKIGSRIVPGRPFESGICEKGRRNVPYGITPTTKVGGAPVVYKDNENQYLVLPDLLNKNIYCFTWDENNRLIEKWKKPGFGMELGAGVTIRREGERKTVLFGNTADDGTAKLTEVTSDGDIVKEIPVNKIPAPMLNPLTAYIGMGPASWMTIPLTDSEHDDILITSYKNNMHSGFSTAYHGNTGAFMWEKDKCGTNIGEAYGFGGMRPFAGYPKGDGTENLISQYPGFQYFADGKTGDITRHYLAHLGTFFYKDKKGDVMKSGPALHSEPIIIKKPELINTNLHYIQYFNEVDYLVLWGGSSFTLGLWLDIKDESGALWSTEYIYQYLNTPTQGVCDINNDGYLEVLGYEHAKDLLTCRCLTSGDLRWTLDVPNADFGRWYATCDINHDGVEELLVCTESKLYAINEKDGKGQIVWSLDIPAPCSGPVVADIDGDGNSEIVLSCDNGYLYIVK
ncbi:MAG: VCBS repeat-containing protein [Clostridia bacterium]|nr:VCBS repeat-containing protein [Clostridia bacterium]